MELFSGPWFGALFSIIVMDLVLAGDNAVVIALAARTLPKDLQRKAIVWGTFGAIIIRVLMTLFVVWLMTIPGLKLVGGLGLIYIAIKLLKPHDDHSSDDTTSNTANIGFVQAIKTIVIADALMGLDNVLAIAGAAKDDFALVVLGLLISVPIVVFGSTMVLKLINRYPWIIYLGAAILAYTALSMVFSEKLIAPYIANIPTFAIYAIEAIGVVATLLLGKIIYKKT